MSLVRVDLALLREIALVASLALALASGGTCNTKRGLCFVPNATTPEDDTTWTQAPGDLTWYYNYGMSPAPTFAQLDQDQFEFVPMLWGAPFQPNDTTFFNTIKAFVTRGIRISHVLAFNEPDLPWQWGGSNVDPSFGAQVWVNNFVPLQGLGIKVGLPATSSSTDGLPWLQQFLGNCSQILSKGSDTFRDCPYDFVPLHWYGSFEGLASHIGQYAATFPNTPLWVTEFNLDNQPLETTQTWYNTSLEYLDRLPEVERYSIFAAFRSEVSNIGPNATMLSDGGELTDIGKWYLGRAGSGALPWSRLSPITQETTRTSDSKPFDSRVTMALWSIFATVLGFRRAVEQGWA